MKNILRPIFAVTIAAALMTATSVSSEAVAAARAFDGLWSVVIYTMRGDCDRAMRYSLRIVGGRVLSPDMSYQANGIVSSGGGIRVVVAQGGRWAAGSGRLYRNSGRGNWRTDNNQCSGQWTAERRAAEY